MFFPSIRQPNIRYVYKHGKVATTVSILGIFLNFQNAFSTDFTDTHSKCELKWMLSQYSNDVEK